jgi:hypothetical protein
MSPAASALLRSGSTSSVYEKKGLLRAIVDESPEDAVAREPDQLPLTRRS